MKREYTILVDEREKKPFTFPEHIVCLDPTRDPCAQRGVTIRLRTQKRTLKTGDYAIDGSTSVVERKGSIDEITQNLLTPDGRRRFADCCKRLRDTTTRPLLLLEGLVGMPEVKAGKPHPGLAVDSLLRILNEHSIGLMVLPTGTPAQRRAAGEWTARWLITQEHHGTSPAHDRNEELPDRSVHGRKLHHDPDVLDDASDVHRNDGRCGSAPRDRMRNELQQAENLHHDH